MKIITYNVNGIKASSSKGLLEWLKKEDADFVCIQEVRANENFAKTLFGEEDNQISFFNTPNDFEKFCKIFNCGNVAGYAGTMILCKSKPNKIVFGIDENDKDNEGRCITLFYDNLVVVNCYVPNGGSRLEYKMEFFDRLTSYLTNLAKTINVIFCSDVNIAHTELDLSHPKECSNRTGFLPMERTALTKLLNSGFCDSVRKFKKNEKVYTWRSYRSRMTTDVDFGWKYRFDYILINKQLESQLVSCEIPDLEYSDHLPIIVEVTFDINSKDK